MARKGRFLEILVEHLEEFLGPEGIEVKSPEEFFQDGRKIGEIDVTLRGDFGTSKVFVGIECRDRPSEPQQGREWIRELIGKRQDLHVNKMIAVSTTGFTKEAIDLADQFDIDLLHVENTEQIDLHGWFQTMTFFWTEETYDITDTIDISTIPESIFDTISLNKNVPFLRPVGSDRFLSLKEMIEQRLDAVFIELPVEIGLVQGDAKLVITESIDAEYRENRFKVIRIVVPLRLSREIIEAKVLLNVCKRLGDLDFAQINRQFIHRK